MTDDLKELGIDAAAIEVKPYADMSREELLECLKAHDAHHAMHHLREASILDVLKRALDACDKSKLALDWGDEAREIINEAEGRV